MVRVVAGELFIELTADVVVAQAGVVLDGRGLDLGDFFGRGERERGAVDALGLGAPPRRRWPSRLLVVAVVVDGGAVDVQRSQKRDEQR